jgi:L-alanine-DL-glutamate epimerase-like enolase superfamily enzyme
MSLEEFHELIDNISKGNNAAKAGLDIAFHDLKAKFNSTSIKSLYQLPESNNHSSFTIGLDSPDIMEVKTIEAIALNFRVLKVKLGGSQDEECIRRIAKIWKGPISVDANQGWKNKDWSLDFCHELKELGVQFVEQPFEKSNLKTAEWLTSRSPLPIIADESCKRFTDLEVLKNCFHGINVKLMKSTGLFEAYKMLQFAKNNQMKTVTGCMAESSCAVAAMSHFSSLADWVDLDGPFLITNDPFESVQLVDGSIQLPRDIGIGVELR